MPVSYLRINLRFASILILAFVVLGCSARPAAQFASNALPGQPILSFPSSEDLLVTTAIGSSPDMQQAGVGGRTLTITKMDIAKRIAMLTIDSSGNMGLRGSYHSLSSRTAKTAIAPYRGDAVAVLDRATIVTFRYRDEPQGTSPHIGIIAEEAPYPITDRDHRSFDLNASIAITMAAERELAARERGLRHEVASLRRELARLRAPR